MHKAQINSMLPDNEKTRKSYWTWFGRYADFLIARGFKNDKQSVVKFLNFHWLDPSKPAPKDGVERYAWTTLRLAVGALNAIFRVTFNIDFKDYPVIYNRIKKMERFSAPVKKAREFTRDEYRKIVSLDPADPRQLTVTFSCFFCF